MLSERDKYGTAKSSALRLNDPSQFGPKFLIDDIVDNNGRPNNFFTNGGLKHPWVQISLTSPVDIMALEITNYGKEVKQWDDKFTWNIILFSILGEQRIWL